MLKIGQLAQRTGETVKTLRFWTNRGLLESIRGKNGYRYYPDEAADRVLHIRSAQALGFSLDEIAEILKLASGSRPPCKEVREGLAAHLQIVRDRIEQLQCLENELVVRLSWADTHPEPDCSSVGCVYLYAPTAVTPF